MATSNLQTEQWIESPLQVATLESDQWLFEPVVTILTANLYTDEWLFESIPISGMLPEFSPSIVSAVRRVQQNHAFPQFVLGGLGLVDNHVLFKKSNTYSIGEFPIWRSPVYRIGTDFDVLGITFPLQVGVTANTRILPKLYFDDESSSSVGTEINITNYPTEKLISLNSKSFDNATHGQANFFLELQFLGDDLAVVGLPMTLELDIQDT